MIRNIVFHIGDPKTGTSSIQRALQKRACTCDSQSIAPQRELNAYGLALSLMPHSETDIRERSFREKARWAAETDADLGIISSEFFLSVPPAALMKALREYLPEHGASARVIAYVRPHASQIVASYLQLTKSGAFTGDLREFLRLREKRTNNLPQARFKRWQDVFGKRFTLRPFMREELHDQDVVADFFHEALYGAEFSLAPHEKLNSTFSLEETAAMRVIQVVLRKQDVPEFLRGAIGHVMEYKLARTANRTQTKLRLGKVNAGKVLSMCLDDAQKLDDQFFGRPLMELALRKTYASAPPNAQPLWAKTYFADAAVDRLRDLACDLAGLLNERPHAWNTDFQLKIGQLHPEHTEPLSEEQQESAKAVWGVLEQITQTIVPTRG